MAINGKIWLENGLIQGHLKVNWGWLLMSEIAPISCDPTLVYPLELIQLGCNPMVSDMVRIVHFSTEKELVWNN